MVFTLKTGVYLHTAYAQASDGSVGFSTTSATDAAYLGQYTDASATDATDPSRYTWMPIDLGAGAGLVDEAGEEVDDGTEGLIDLLNRDLYDTGQFAPDTQATGDRKVQTYFQAEEPDPEEYVFGVGDLWQDTDDGNHLYRWNGTAWVDAQDGGIGAAAELAQAVQEVLNGLTVVDANGVTKVNGGRIDTDTLFAQDITATGTITGAQLIGAILSGNAIDIQAVIDATSIGLKTELVDNSYCLVLSAAGGTTKSSITLSRGSLKLVGQSLLSLDTQELAVNANSIQFTVAEGSYCPYYKAGDTVTITRMYCAGGVTGSGTNLYFYIPLAKPLIGVSNVTISNPTKAIITARKVEGGYIAQDATVSSLGTPSCVPYEGGVTIGIKASSAYNTKNNTPVTVTPENLVLKFT